jgi:DNA-binding helix-hairpin-helix protein with protein kinase domain
MRVRLEGKAQDILLEGPLLGRGGEASIYAVPGRPDLAAKIYHNPSDQHAGKLAAMLAAPPIAPPGRGQHFPVAWPIGRLLDFDGEDRVIGYLMPRRENAHLIWEIYNPGVRRQICPHFHFASLLRSARNLAAVVRTLHECGYIIGDLNESNVLVTPQALVTLIDADSFQVPAPDRLYRCGVGRPEYTPPELQGVSFADVDRLPQHDAFALAVLIFQLLMQGIHPFAGTSATDQEPGALSARIAQGHWPYAWTRPGPIQPSPHAPPWWVLPPIVQELLRRCFEDDHAQPDLRPSAAGWQLALEEAERQLTTCVRNSQHVYPQGLDHCPWCVLRSARTSRPPKAQARSVSDGPANPSLALRACNTNNPTRKKVHDPLPPRADGAQAVTPSADGAVEMALQALGRGLEQRGWLIWLCVALLGVVAGIVYALQRATPGGNPGL